MNTVDVLEMLKSLGGYGVAGLMYFLWQQERLERIRYRDRFEEVLKSLPELTRTLNELVKEVSSITQGNPRS